MSDHPREHRSKPTEGHVARLRRDNARLRKALRSVASVLALMDDDGRRAEVIVAGEDPEVRLLCERSGYGAVMDSAARQWFVKDDLGAHVCGPCAATVRAVKAEVKAALKGAEPPKRRAR